MTKKESMRRMKFFRRKINVTQQQVGDMLGCTRGNICNIEKGRNILTDEMWSRMQTIYKKVFGNDYSN
jgi:DNA-binding XRE family transcriptional regulator